MADLTLQVFDSKNQRTVNPKEPLYSLLATAHPDSVRYLLDTLNNFDDDAQLEDVFPEVGLTRREFLEQVYLVVGYP